MAGDDSREKHFKFNPGGSRGIVAKLREYQRLVVGEKGLGFLILLEGLQLLLMGIPGAMGMLLRGFFYRFLFAELGKGAVIGRNVSLRHPHKIRIGSGTVVDDDVLLDAKGSGNEGIKLGSGVFVGRNSILSCKNGNITLEDGANMGFHCEVFSANQVTIGKNCIIAAYTYLVGGGSYRTDATAIPMSAYPLYEGKGGVHLEDGVWLGAHVVVLDGVTIGHDTAVAAGAIVNRTLAPMGIYGGVPAKRLSERKES